MKVLLTGSAGFIGYHTALKLLSAGFEVVGLDNLNEYYDVNLKLSRLADAGIDKDTIGYNKAGTSRINPNYKFIRLQLEDSENLSCLFGREKFDMVCNLAAQAGVRYSLENPSAYISSNIEGFTNILESCRKNNIKHLVYASSSSVYGLNRRMPFSVTHNVDHPISLYAATKKSNELMAHAYSYLFGIPSTGLRFFTVYGPWGRPDMAIFLFTRAILEGKPIDLYKEGSMERDFTYVDDVADAITRILCKSPESDPDWNGINPNPSTSPAPYKIYNVGNDKPVKVTTIVSEIEKATGRKALINYLPVQPGDVEKTWADISDLAKDFNYAPSTTVSVGIARFVKWYRDFYKK